MMRRPDKTLCSPASIVPSKGLARQEVAGFKLARIAIEQTSGRQRLNIHGAVDREIANTGMIEFEAAIGHSIARGSRSLRSEAVRPRPAPTAV